MPSLLTIVVGSQIIVDKDNGLVSVISIFSGFKAQKLKEASDENEKAPLNWGCAVILRRIPEDDGKVYEMRFQLIEPDGVVNFESANPFTMTELTQSMVLRGSDFPASKEGDYTITASVREYGKKEGWEEVGRYPINVRHQPTTEMEEQSTEMEKG